MKPAKKKPQKPKDSPWKLPQVTREQVLFAAFTALGAVAHFGSDWLKHLN